MLYKVVFAALLLCLTSLVVAPARAADPPAPQVIYLYPTGSSTLQGANEK
jgi:hypothetical protein